MIYRNALWREVTTKNDKKQILSAQEHFRKNLVDRENQQIS